MEHHPAHEHAQREQRERLEAVVMGGEVPIGTVPVRGHRKDAAHTANRSSSPMTATALDTDASGGDSGMGAPEDTV